VYIIVLLLISCIGAALIVGAYRRWKWLIDPPTEWAWFYSQSWVKKSFGQKTLLVYTYIIGCMIFFLGVAGIIFFAFDLGGLGRT